MVDFMTIRVFLCCLLFSPVFLYAQDVRQTFLLEKGWRFSKGDVEQAQTVRFDDRGWGAVTVPHDWAIYGPFDREHDLQEVAVTQNGEKVATVKTGRTGGLPYVGVGWYRNTFDVVSFEKSQKRVVLKFDGAMSEARVLVNGQEACYWPYGYNAFHCDVTDFINASGNDNVIAVRLENRPQSSRWYPGAGLYRNVHVIVTDKVHVPVWGTYITTPFVSDTLASVRLETNIERADGKVVRVTTEIIDGEGKVVSSKDNAQKINYGQPFV